MTTVREATFELFRRQGMTTIFGNPGSTELPMLGDFPSDFRYILGLQEAVVVGMADGYAQAAGQVTHVNLHTAPGVGNAMGALFNAQANHSPLLVTAGQQVRAQITMQANLTNRDATRVVHPYVKWAFEPPRAADVPAAIAQGIHRASLPPKGPTFVSIPMDDWTQEIDDGDVRHVATRTVTGRAGADPETVAALARRLEAASSPVLVAGPDVDASGAWETAIALAEKQRLGVWASPAPGGGRLGFPEGHPNFQGTLPPGIGAVAGALAGHDLLLLARPSGFPHYPHIPRPPPPRGAPPLPVPPPPPRGARAPRGDPGRPPLPPPPRRCPGAPGSSRSPPTPTRRRARRWATRSSPMSRSRSARCWPRSRRATASRPSRSATRRRSTTPTRSAPARCTPRSA